MSMTGLSTIDSSDKVTMQFYVDLEDEQELVEVPSVISLPTDPENMAAFYLSMVEVCTVRTSILLPATV